MNPRILAVLGWLGIATAASAADQCEHRAERNLDLDAAAVATLALRAGAGDLAVRGEQGMDRVVVRGIACASDADRLAGIQLLQQTDGDRLEIAAQLPEAGSSSGWFGSTYQRLDLELRVPARLVLDVTDSSGDTSVRGVAAATVKDSSGDLDLHDIAGDLSVTDSSGDIDVRRVGGNVRIPSDSSGDIEIVEVGGNVAIDADSSGDIELREVRGDATVEVDSSGSIHFTDIDGSATVGSDSSGSIDATRIGRDFTVRRDGSGGIRHRDVAGKVSVPAE